MGRGDRQQKRQVADRYVTPPRSCPCGLLAAAEGTVVEWSQASVSRQSARSTRWREAGEGEHTPGEQGRCYCILSSLFPVVVASRSGPVVSCGALQPHGVVFGL